LLFEKRERLTDEEAKSPQTTDLRYRAAIVRDTLLILPGKDDFLMIGKASSLEEIHRSLYRLSSNEVRLIEKIGSCAEKLGTKVLSR